MKQNIIHHLNHGFILSECEPTCLDRCSKDPVNESPCVAYCNLCCKQYSCVVTVTYAIKERCPCYIPPGPSHLHMEPNN